MTAHVPVLGPRLTGSQTSRGPPMEQECLTPQDFLQKTGTAPFIDCAYDTFFNEVMRRQPCPRCSQHMLVFNPRLRGRQVAATLWCVPCGVARTFQNMPNFPSRSYHRKHAQDNREKAIEQKKKRQEIEREQRNNDQQQGVPLHTPGASEPESSCLTPCLHCSKIFKGDRGLRVHLKTCQKALSAAASISHSAREQG